MAENSTQNRRGVLLVNIGSPRSATRDDVKAYLAEFLMDKHVIDLPWLLRLLLVRGIIVPHRVSHSTSLYAQIASPAGLPLSVNMLELQNSLQQTMAADGYRIAIGMHYGKPSLQEAMTTLVKQQVETITIVPLYPQETLATTIGALDACRNCCRQIQPNIPIHVVSPFFDDEGYIAAQVALIQHGLHGQLPDALLFSYHNIPQRHLQKLAGHRQLDESSERCCHDPHCYLAQCRMTTQMITARLGFDHIPVTTAFQSNLGNHKSWLAPLTSTTIRALAGRGIQHLAVVCPGLIVDCLETQIDLATVGKQIFLAHGGTSYQLIAALGSTTPWIAALATLIRRSHSPLIY